MSTAVHEPTGPFNVGVYSLREASRLVGMRPDRVKRLVKGYEFKGRSGQRSAMPPLFRGQFEDMGGVINLSFLDLIELLFVRDFRAHGVSMPVIRRAAQVAAELFGDSDHPFCLEQFSTDGKRIFATAATQEGDQHMLDLVQRQHVIKSVVEPFVENLQYEAGQLRRWFPLGKDRPVVLDPRFSFGAPIVEKYGVPTKVLYAASKAGDTEEEIAYWFDMPVPPVSAAIEFERGLELKAA